jgi:lipopolysaccharide/colanic/teichoic acid biosynthesis glycosyltransferase
MNLACRSDFRKDLRAHADEALLGEGTAWFLPCKSIAEVAIASVLLLLTAPLVLLLLLLVKATSRGPAIFRQVRVGRGGRAYELYKIRTMAHDCERLTGPRWSPAGDPRVTPLGRFLRRSHLDELPQLWNVIRGEMSLVGPRPERPEFVARLEGVVPNYRGRLAINPGITGLAQIQLPPDENLDDVRRKVACDLCYIRQMGPILDLKILLGTALKVAGLSFKMTHRVLNLPGVAGEDPAAVARIAPEPGPITQLQST